MRPDGSGQRLLTGALHAKRGSFSPDGSRLVFDGPVAVRNRVVMFDFDVYVMDADGSHPVRLTIASSDDWATDWQP